MRPTCFVVWLFRTPNQPFLPKNSTIAYGALLTKKEAK
jgi:hypothetical protein